MAAKCYGNRFETARSTKRVERMVANCHDIIHKSRYYDPSRFIFIRFIYFAHTCVSLRAPFHRALSSSFSSHLRTLRTSKTCRYNLCDNFVIRILLTERRESSPLPGQFALFPRFSPPLSLSLSSFLSARRAFVTFSFGPREFVVTLNFIARP